MIEKNYQEEIIELGYNEENITPKLTPIYSKDKERIYIFNNYYGIVLTKREKQDKHVLITTILKKHGTWQKGSIEEFSAYWLYDINELFYFVQKYLEESDLFNKIKYGYEFK